MVADFVLLDFPEQEKLTLTADIKYKSNWQQGAMKGTRSFGVADRHLVLIHGLFQPGVATNGSAL